MGSVQRRLRRLEAVHTARGSGKGRVLLSLVRKGSELEDEAHAFEAAGIVASPDVFTILRVIVGMVPGDIMPSIRPCAAIRGSRAGLENNQRISGHGRQRRG